MKFFLFIYHIIVFEYPPGEAEKKNESKKQTLLLDEWHHAVIFQSKYSSSSSLISDAIFAEFKFYGNVRKKIYIHHNHNRKRNGSVKIKQIVFG